MGAIIWAAGGVCLLGAACLIRSFWEVRHFGVTRVTVSADTIKKDMTFAVVSDLHNAEFGKDNEALLQCLKQEKPDAVLIPGDLITGTKGKDTAPAERFLKQVSRHYPVFYCPGNHEARTIGNPETYGDSFRNYWERVGLLEHVILLQNQTVSFQGIALTGLDLENDYYKKRGRVVLSSEEIKSRLGLKADGVFTVLLAHMPEYLSAYAEWGADLVLSGHNHGGIVRLPFLGGVLSASLQWFSPMCGGIHKEKDTTMIISRGLGAHTIPVRFLNLPELVIVNLKKKG